MVGRAEPGRGFWIWILRMPCLISKRKYGGDTICASGGVEGLSTRWSKGLVGGVWEINVDGGAKKEVLGSWAEHAIRVDCEGE